MPPAPKSPRQPRAGPSTLPPGTHRAKSLAQRDPEGLPGVSKIKASIRQTKRFLAKDNLEPGLRVQTQRRLTSLMADLERAERRGVEKKFGARYHKVKFFERQKLLRLIKRFQKTASASSATDKETKRAEQDLERARVMLNYILHFPNTEKYISLFPDSESTSDPTHPDSSAPDSSTADATPSTLTLPPHLTPPIPNVGSLDKTSARRLEVLLSMKKAMGDGRVSGRPEEGLGDGRESHEGGGRGRGRGKVDLDLDVDLGGSGSGRLGAEKHDGKEEAKAKGKKADQKATKAEGNGEEVTQLEVKDGRGKKSKRMSEVGRSEGEDASGEKRNKKRKSGAAEQGGQERPEENKKGKEGKEKKKSKEEKRAQAKDKDKETPAAKPAVAEEQDDFFESD